MNIEDVLKLAQLGFRMHPLQARNKIPLLGKWTERATKDEKTIRMWYSQYPDANWGIATGEDFIVIDIDPKSGGNESWYYIQPEDPTPETATVETGSGGLHYYYKTPKGMKIRNSSGKIGKGVDVRGVNGQVVAPGSLHPSGNFYRWLKSPEDTPIVQLPQWIIDLIEEDTTPEFTPVGGKLEKGSRNNSIYHASLALARQGASRDFIIATIYKWLDTQHQKDFPEDEVQKTVDSAIEVAKAKPVDISNRSDVFNAELMIQSYGDNLVYVNGLGWHFWNGKVWEPDLDDVIVTQLFIKTMKSLQDEAAQKIASSSTKSEMREAAALAAWAVRSLSAGSITAAIKLAGTLPGVRKNPDDIDSIHTLWLLNCNNGTLDLRTGELYPHRKADLITKLVPFDYDPEAKAPFWEDSLKLIFDGNQALVGYMQRALGYSLTGSQDERCFFICWGESGANGKSTILETIQDILGPGYSQMSDMVVITSATTDNRVSSSLAKLHGARFVNMNEAEENQKLSEALIKQLTGGDSVQACYKYKNPFEFKPVFKLWIRTNEKPVIRSQTNALWDRVKLIPFERSIPKELRLPRTEVDRRFREEAPGILTWLINGVKMWMAEKGLQDPPEVTMAIQGYRVDSDLVRIFLDESTEAKQGARTKAQDLYSAFVMWSKYGGEKWVMNKIRFTRRVKSCEIPTERSNGQTYFVGIALTQAAAMYIM